MKKLEQCPICNSKDINPFLKTKDYSTSKEDFHIVSCETCSFTATSPRPDDKDLDKYYLSESYISHTNDKDGLFNFLYQNVRKIAIKSKLSLLLSVAEKSTHLDIGCGTGEFLNACKNSGFKTKGIEPSSIARKKAIKNYKLDISKNTNLSQYNENSFSSISMWHVLEHVANLEETILMINKILKNNGIAIIAVPNKESWDAKYYKNYWAAWDVPIHLWHFSKDTIKKIFEKHGFELIKTKGMIFDAYYVSLLSEQYRYGKKNFLRAFFIGLISNIYAVFTKNGHSSNIYIFKNSK